MYVPTSDSDEDEVNTFYNMVDEAYCQYKSYDIMIIMRDLNAKTGEGKVANIASPFGPGVRNERAGNSLDIFCV